jgi:hypothetical protein
LGYWGWFVSGDQAAQGVHETGSTLLQGAAEAVGWVNDDRKLGVMCLGAAEWCAVVARSPRRVKAQAQVKAHDPNPNPHLNLSLSLNGSSSP